MPERTARCEAVTHHKSHKLEPVLTVGGKLILKYRVCGCSNLKSDPGRTPALELCPTVLEVVTEVGLEGRLSAIGLRGQTNGRI